MYHFLNKLGKFSLQEVHDILTALRGPDSNSQRSLEWKESFTTPIRSWFYEIPVKELEGRGMTGGDKPPTDIKGWAELEARADALMVLSDPSITFGDRHYLMHARHAFQAIIEYERTRV